MAETVTRWITSYDIEPGWGPIEAKLVGHASIGQRTDWAWVDLEPPLRVEAEAISRALLGARHRGDSVWSVPSRWPIHVYVCLPKQPDQTRDTFTSEGVSILFWGLLHKSLERAELDKY